MSSRRTDAGPPLGWENTIAFLILPVLLVISQFVSMQLMQPKTDDPAQQQSNAILKFLPLMIGWFSLSVPAALTVYWFANNIITTASSVIIRNSMDFEPVSGGGGGASSAVAEPPQSTIFTPPREKPSGFGAAPTFSPDEVKPLTAMDAEIVTSTADDGGEDDSESGSGMEQQAASKPQKKKRGKKRRKKN